jgi:hypothetical protein
MSTGLSDLDNLSGEKSRRPGNSNMHQVLHSAAKRQRQAAAGGWWLVAGGWWLVAGGWWLVAGG